MKNVIAAAEKDRENRKLLAIKNVNKTVMAEATKVLSTINRGNKYSWVISNADIDVAKDLGLTSNIKYWRCTSQIQDKIDGLHKDWISAIGTFVKYFWRMHNNEKLTENMIIRCEIDPEWVSSLFV